jgi:hypothetical protein
LVEYYYYYGVKLPSLKQIEAMEQQREQAFAALEINHADNTVKCQSCGVAVPIRVGPISKPYNHQVFKLRYQKKWLQRYVQRLTHGGHSKSKDAASVRDGPIARGPYAAGAARDGDVDVDDVDGGNTSVYKDKIPKHYADEIKQIDAELKELEEEEAQADAKRRIPLHPAKNRATGYRYVCGNCFENVYNRRRRSSRRD